MADPDPIRTLEDLVEAALEGLTPPPHAQDQDPQRAYTDPTSFRLRGGGNPGDRRHSEQCVAQLRQAFIQMGCTPTTGIQAGRGSFGNVNTGRGSGGLFPDPLTPLKTPAPTSTGLDPSTQTPGIPDPMFPANPDTGASPYARTTSTGSGSRRSSIARQPIRGRFTPRTNSVYTAGRLFTKADRVGMRAEKWAGIHKEATRKILPKKLNDVFKTDTDEDKLDQVFNVHRLVDLMIQQMHKYDFDEPITRLVTPIQFGNQWIAKPGEEHDLSQEYPALPIAYVANSTRWYRLWSKDDLYLQDLDMQMEFLENNTHDSLWTTCLADQKSYPEEAHGGPLMFALILRRIMNTSETAIDNCVKKLKNYKISDTKGEDVDRAVNLIRATHELLLSVSHVGHNYVPTDFPKILLDVFQTTSVPQFNHPFYKLKTETVMKADAEGVLPKWPTVEAITNLASNSYNRLKDSGKWDVPKGSDASAFLGEGGTSSTGGSASKKKIICFNCGQEGHLATKCPKPKDTAKIEEARKKFLEEKAKKGKLNCPKTKMMNGKPYKLNKNGAYVLDQAKIRKQKEKLDGLADDLVNLTVAAAGGSVAPSAVSDPTAATASTNAQTQTSGSETQTQNTQANQQATPAVHAAIVSKIKEKLAQYVKAPYSE